MDFLKRIYEKLGEEGLKKARWQTRMRVLGMALELAFMLLYVELWALTPLGPKLAERVGGNPWLYALAFFLGQTLFNLPLDYFSRWVELRLGTNRQPFSGWLLDLLKQGAVQVALMTLLFGGAYAVMRAWPQAAPGIFLALVAAFAGLLYALQPLLLRLEFRAEPLEDEALTARLRALFERAGVPFRGVFRLRAGEKTSRGNAGVIPKVGGYEVVFTDTLLEALDPKALSFVVAHELGHVQHRDNQRGLFAFAALLYLALLAGYVLVGTPTLLRFPLFYLGTQLAFVLGRLAMNHLVRTQEYAADRFAIRLVPDLDAFERSFLVLSQQNFEDPDPPAWIETLLYDHPSIKHRYQALKRALEQK